MDPVTGGLVATAGLVSKDLLLKAFGPTAEYLGGELRNLVERCNINIEDVCMAAVRKANGKTFDNSVPPRIAKRVIDDAAYCDSSLVKDYYGGFLCGARQGDANDDCVPYLSMLKGMSELQVKTHFLVYSFFHKTYSGKLNTVTNKTGRRQSLICLDIAEYMKFIGRPADAWEATINHVVNGLSRLDLIGDYSHFGSPEYLRTATLGIEMPTASLLVESTILGVELFLWAAGMNLGHPDAILDPNTELLNTFPEEFQNIK